MKKTDLLLYILIVTMGNIALYAEHYSLIIIGSGPAGLTAGVYAGRSNLNTLILAGEKMGGQLVEVVAIENWPGQEHIAGADLMAKMRDHAQKVGCTIRSETAKELILDKSPFSIKTTDGKTYTADALIISIGLVPLKLNCPGEKKYWGTGGVASCALCEGPSYKDNNSVVIVGGGKMALDNARFLHRFTQNITILNDYKKFTGPDDLIREITNLPGIKIYYNVRVKEIKGNDKHLTSVDVIDNRTKKMSNFPADAVFVSVGLEPHTDIVKGKLELNGDGKIKTDEFAHTSLPGVFAAGGTATLPYSQAIICASSGCIAALEAEKYLEKKQGLTHYNS